MVVALLAAEHAGGARWCLETATEYAKVRVQFGRPIGQFQAVKHRAADMAVRVDQLAAVAWDAVLAVDAALDAGAAAPRRAGAADDGAELAVAAAAALALDGYVTLRPGLPAAPRGDRIHLGARRSPPSEAGPGRPPAVGWERHLPDCGWPPPPGGAPGGRSRPTCPTRPDAGARSWPRSSPNSWRRRVAGPPTPAGGRRPGLPALARALGPGRRRRRAGGHRRAAGRGRNRPPPPRRGGVGAARAHRVRHSGTAGALGAAHPARRDSRGASSSPNRAPARTWPACRCGPSGWTADGSSPARRSGRPWPTSRSGGSAWPGPTPTAPKHEGITYFIVDMASPGLDVRPLRELTGAALFNEVFFDQVFVPDDAVIGEVHRGWGIARMTLANERVSISSGATFGIGCGVPGPPGRPPGGRGARGHRAPPRRAAGRGPVAPADDPPVRRCGPWPGRTRARRPACASCSVPSTSSGSRSSAW